MNAKKGLIVLVLAAAIGVFFYLDLWRYLTLEALKANRALLVNYYASHEIQTVLGFIVVYVLVTALSLPGAAVLSLAAGAIFGVWRGTLYAVIGATAGATLNFLVTRYLLREPVLRRFGPRLEKINAELETRGGNYLLFLRLVPLFPFFLINLAAAVTRLPLRTFVLVTAIGIIPGGFVYCNAGESLASIDSLKGIVSGRVLFSFALLGFFSLVPALFSRKKEG